MSHTSVASINRYVAGVVEFVVVPDNASYPIQVGDLVYMAGGVAYPASRQADQNTPTANYLLFASLFLGVACSKDGLQTGETSFRLTTRKGWVLVATTGDFRFPCAATSWATGDLVSGVEISAGTGLEDQKVAKTTVPGASIGIAKVPVNAIGNSLTEVIFSLRSAIMTENVGSGE